MQYQGVHVNISENRPDLSNVYKEEDPFRIFNGVSKKVQDLIVNQGFGTTEDWHLINNIVGRMSLGGTSRELDRKLGLWAKFVGLVERHPLINVLQKSEEEDNRDETSGLIVHAWQKNVKCELASIRAELDCEALRAMGTEAEITLPRLDISHLAWEAINNVGHLLREEIKKEDNRQWQERVSRERENQRLIKPQIVVKKYSREQANNSGSFFSKIFCCGGKRDGHSYYE